MGGAHLWAVIMAGGSGTRFWPASRKALPKQYLRLFGDRSLLQDTAARLAPDIPMERIMVVTAASQAHLVRRDLPELPEANILAEPCARNTAPCIALAAEVLFRRDPDAIMAVMPSDHRIARPENWRALLVAAASEAAVEGRVCVFGIPPDRPHTGYGYVKFGDCLRKEGEISLHAVEGFREKPDEATARRFLDEGSYYWNSGCFAWRASTVRALTKRHLPDLAEGLAPLAERVDGEGFAGKLAEIYPRLPSISVDYGIMEKLDGILGFPADIAWSDVGSWGALAELLPGDESGHTGPSPRISIDARNCLVYGEGDRIVALVGVEDLAVVVTDDAVLVCPKDRDQDVRAVVERLKAEGQDERL